MFAQNASAGNIAEVGCPRVVDRLLACMPDMHRTSLDDAQHEVVTAVSLPTVTTHSAYVKLRRRGSIDFPIAGAAVALQLDGDVVAGCRIALSAVASHPLDARAAAEFMVGKRVDEETVRTAAELAAKPAKPLDNADLTHFWRKRMVRVVVEQAILAATKKEGSAVKLSGT